MTEPIRPSEVVDKKAAEIPAIIIDTVNQLILKNWRNSKATIYQKELLNLVTERDHTLSEEKIFGDGLFDFEDIFRKVGWLVEYDKPGYNETYEAYFVFKKK